MSYTKTTWVEGVTRLSPTNMNKIEKGIADAHDGISDIDIKSALRAAITIAQSLNEDNYTTESWEGMDSLINEALSVYSDPEASYAQINLFTTSLINHIKSLEIVASTDNGEVIEITPQEINGNILHTLDLSEGVSFKITIVEAGENENEIHFDNVPNRDYIKVNLQLDVIAAGCEITYPDEVEWIGSTLTRPRVGIYNIVFITYDGGTNWRAYCLEVLEKRIADLESNSLDTENGIWTPALVYDDSGIVEVTNEYAECAGSYAKIGNLVHIEGYLNIPPIGTFATDKPLRIVDLPFIPENALGVNIGINLKGSDTGTANNIDPLAILNAQGDLELHSFKLTINGEYVSGSYTPMRLYDFNWDDAVIEIRIAGTYICE